MTRRFVVRAEVPVIRGHGTVIVLGYLFQLGSSTCLSTRRTYEPDAQGHYTEAPSILARSVPTGPRWRCTHEIELRNDTAQMLLQDCRWKVVKTRFALADPFGHVDVYHWANEGLTLGNLVGIGKAPDWCGEEVTGDFRYDDEQLAVYPYSEWAEAG